MKTFLHVLFSAGSLVYLGTAHPVLAEESATYRIDPCPIVYRVSLHGLPAEPRTLPHVETCGTETDHNLLDFDVSKFVGDQAEMDALHAQAPLLTLKPGEGGLDLRVVMRDGSQTRVYERKRLQPSPGEARLELVRVGHEGGPDIAASIQRLETEPSVGLHVIDAPVQQLARDLARIKQLEVRNIERLDPGMTVSFMFSKIRADSVLQLIADAGGQSVTRDDKGVFVFGAVKDFKAIQEQWELIAGFHERGDQAGLRKALEKIVELAKPDDADDIEVWVPDVLDQLANLAVKDKDYVRAKALQIQRMAHVERESTRDSAEYAMALADLATLHGRLGEADQAKPLVDRALALVDKHQHKSGLISARVLSQLARGELDASRMESAAALNLRAFELLKKGGESDYDALSQAIEIETELSNHYTDLKQHAAAQPHDERNYALWEQLLGPEDPMLDTWRTTLIHNAHVQGKNALAATYLERQIALSEKRAVPASDAYADALVDLTMYHVWQGKLGEAISLWQRMVKLRGDVLGPNHPGVVAALNDLATLQRMDGQDAQAAASARRAAAIVPDPDGKRAASVEESLRKSLERDLGKQLTIEHEIELFRHSDKPTFTDLQLASIQDRLGELNAVAATLIALRHFEQALALRLKAQGRDHPDTQRTARRLIELYEQGSDKAGAERVKQRLRS